MDSIESLEPEPKEPKRPTDFQFGDDLVRKDNGEPVGKFVGYEFDPNSNQYLAVTSLEFEKSDIILRYEPNSIEKKK